MGAVYIHLGKLPEAQAALMEALRHKQENWKIWENFVIVSARLRDCASTIQGLRKLIDMGKSVDIDVLGLMAHAVANNVPLRSGDTGRSLTKQMDDLVAAIREKSDMSAALWQLFADYNSGLGRWKPAFECSLGELRALEGTWDKDADSKRYEHFSIEITHKDGLVLLALLFA